MPKIHPTASVDPGAELGDDVEIGPYAVVEDRVKIGAGTVLRPHAVVLRHTTMGEGNFVDCHAVLGGLPQDLKFSPATETCLHVGDRNTFREGVTINRGSKEGHATTIGNGTYWMMCSHAGHDVTVGDGAIFANTAAVGGHARIGANTFLSANTAVHQFCWVGERVMFQGAAHTSSHVPPFVMLAGINDVAGLNRVGISRAQELSGQDAAEIKAAFRVLYRSGLRIRDALDEMDRHEEWGAAAKKFREFIREVVNAEPPFRRPLCPMRRRSRYGGDGGDS